jgi:uncharacterized protein YcbX
VSEATVTSRGGFSHDRRFALLDDRGRCVNGKIEPRVHAVRVAYDETLTAGIFTGGEADGRRRFRLDADGDALATWLGGIVARPIRLARDDDGGFPDDTVAPGPTIVSTATLAAVAAWFPGLTVESVRRRLRTNIEVDGVPPFWEDRLFGAAGTGVPFRIGDVAFEGTNPCQRCVVPSRDPESGEALAAFAKRVGAERAAALPEWADRTRFDHFYRLAVNTRPAGVHTGGRVRVGDPVLV